MQVSRNEKMIKRRAQLGIYATFAGLGILLAGMIVSFRVQQLWLSMAALVLGFVLSQYGNYNLRRWGSSPRPDQVIESSLKGFDDKYLLYAWSLPAPYVLLTPQGLYTMTTRDQTGQITVNGSQWKSKMSLGRILMVFAQEGLGNPGGEAMDAAGRLDKWIKASLPEVAVTTQPMVVFLKENVQLSVTEPAVPVMQAGSLKKWLRGPGKGPTLKSSDYRALEKLFDGAAAR
jgi:hypothetical protein